MTFLIYFSVLLTTNPVAHSDYSAKDFDKTQFAQTKKSSKKDKWRLTSSIIFDARLTSTGKDRNWLDADAAGNGGPGISRYGGSQDDAKQSLTVAQTSLVSEISILNTAQFHLQLNFDRLTTDSDASRLVTLFEAYAKKTLNFNSADTLQFRFGLLVPEYSLENQSKGWTPSYTITPSAINTWFGEEVRPIALELTYSHAFDDIDASFSLAGFSGNDVSGSVLSWRGWALSDRQLGLGSTVRYQQQPHSSTQTGDPFSEIDGNIGAYTSITVDWLSRLKLSVAYQDNFAQTTKRNLSNSDFTWETRFLHIGAQWHITSSLSLIGQVMDGQTSSKANTWLVDNDLFSWYLLATYKRNNHRFSLRYDEFEVTDLDTDTDANFQDGTSWTIAYIYSLDSFQSIATEYLTIDSDRPGNGGFGNQDPSDDLFQVSYRLKY